MIHPQQLDYRIDKSTMLLIKTFKQTLIMEILDGIAYKRGD
jgi:hypothetical protein